MEPSFCFTTPFNVNIVEVKGEEKTFLEGMISSTDKDLVNDIVTKKCLESMQNQILNRNIKLDIEHESFRGDSFEEKEINKTKIPAGKIIDATVEEIGKNRFGLRVKSELNRNHQFSEQIKGNVLERYLDAYSIAFIATETKDIQENGEPIRLLNDVKLLNVALTGNPVNTTALNRDVVIKSISALEEYKNEKKLNPELEKKLEVKHSHLSDIKLNNRRYKNMTEEETSKESEQTEEKPIEAESTEEKPVETEQKKFPKKKKEEEDEDEKKKEKKDSEEVKNLRTEVEELKAILNKPRFKSLISQEDKSKNFEQKSMSPLDVIA